ncbi:MAG TPA: TIM barrel protein [Candidatus Avacidaminococcus intestinavium]|uniref:TIM barrel protein n=1 Tax=Candidatus Avacidaminococcus intestinavium TaxID=2840684 RepID=A0A9D1MPQ2_9FIRM|nr:TIM barrel protein [Candidatus Avacidaminococcus intestinavium]
MMRFSISDLAFGGFKATRLESLPPEIGVEIFYEFGSDLYWDKRLETVLAGRRISIHAPCVGINLADPTDENYLEVFRNTLEYAKKCEAEFVVVHSNEEWKGEREEVMALVESRISEILTLAKIFNVPILLENVGLKTNGTLLYDWHDYVALIDKFPEANALIDIGHAHVNDWNIVEVLVVLQKRIKAMHLHDNNGRQDQHLLIGKGEIDWEVYFKKAERIIPQAVQVLEYVEIKPEKVVKHLNKVVDKYLREKINKQKS